MGSLCRESGRPRILARVEAAAIAAYRMALTIFPESRMKRRCSFYPAGAGVFLTALSLVSLLLAQLPPSKGAPQVGQKAPDFTALDLSGKPVKLSELFAAPLPIEPRLAGKTSAAKKASWGLLIFYRGYW